MNFYGHSFFNISNNNELFHTSVHLHFCHSYVWTIKIDLSGKYSFLASLSATNFRHLFFFER